MTLPGIARFQGRRVKTIARALHVQPQPVAA